MSLCGFGPDRVQEILVAYNLRDKEHHMYPVEGSIDFRAVFTPIESMGYTGQYTNGFGNMDDKPLPKQFLLSPMPDFLEVGAKPSAQPSIIIRVERLLDFSIFTRPILHQSDQSFNPSLNATSL